MDDMILTRAHFWAVHLVKDFITARSDKKVEPIYEYSISLVAFFTSTVLKGSTSTAMPSRPDTNNHPRDTYLDRIYDPTPGVSLHAVYCVITSHRISS